MTKLSELGFEEKFMDDILMIGLNIKSKTGFTLKEIFSDDQF